MPRQPSPSTLNRYGLTLVDWKAMLVRQGGVCAVCKLDRDYLVIDHEHPPISIWRKMGPEERRKTVRGLLCAWCNGDLGWRWTPAKLRNAAKYLARHEKRKERMLERVS